MNEVFCGECKYCENNENSMSDQSFFKTKKPRYSCKVVSRKEVITFLKRETVTHIEDRGDCSKLNKNNDCDMFCKGIQS